MGRKAKKSGSGAGTLVVGIVVDAHGAIDKRALGAADIASVDNDERCHGELLPGFQIV